MGITQDSVLLCTLLLNGVSSFVLSLASELQSMGWAPVRLTRVQIVSILIALSV